jgi:hypothetical protein
MTYGRVMVRLIPLPDREGRPGDARLWFNPEHITTAAPAVSRSQDAAGDTFTLSVELKLEGLPMQRAWLAMCRTAEETDQKWRQFLDLVAGPDVP